MPIEYQAPGAARLYGQAAQMSGEAEAIKRQFAMQAERAAIQGRLNAAKEQSIFEAKLQRERERYHSLMDFEAEKRAKAWEIEKMELRSRLDFQEEEKKRLQNKNEYELGMKQIAELAKNGQVDSDERIRMETDLYFDKVVQAPMIAYPKEEKDVTSQLLETIRKKQAGQPTGTPALQFGQPVTEKTAIKEVTRLSQKPWSYTNPFEYFKRKLTGQWEATSEETEEHGVFTEKVKVPSISKIIPVKTQTEYDALPIGARYTLPDGRQGTKR